MALHAAQPSAYAQLLQRLDDIAGSMIACEVDALPELSEPGIARQLSAQLPPGLTYQIKIVEPHDFSAMRLYKSSACI